MIEQIKIEDLCVWSDPIQIDTRNGPRNLRKARPTDEFWRAWRASKADLKAAGVSCGKDKLTGDWEAQWWLPLDPEEGRKRAEALEASRATDSDVEVPCPEGLAYMPFQKAGVAYALAREATLLSDSMGLGKSIEAIGVFNADPSVKTILIVCPASLRLNWQKEWERWSVRRSTIGIVNGGKASAWPISDQTAGYTSVIKGEEIPAEIVIINYDVLQQHRKRIDAVEWDLLICDEIHYCKNPKAKRTRAVFGWKTQNGERKQEPIEARRKLYLTGTPIVNRPVELWPLAESLDPEGLGQNFFRFAKRYCDAKRNRWGWDFSGASRLDELQEKLRERFMVRRLKSEVLKDLPAKRRQVIEMPANGAEGIVKEQMEIWSGHRERIEDLEGQLLEAEAAGDRGLIAELSRKLGSESQGAFEDLSALRHEVALAKVPMVVEHLRSALEEGPVICFAWHRDVIAAIAFHFWDNAVTLTGETKMEDRQQAVDDFQAGRIDLFVGNIQAAGVGITLTRSSHVVFAELDWVPGNLSQAEDRAHRIGQRESVLVQHLVLEGSLDAYMAGKLIAKQDVIDQTLDRKPEYQASNYAQAGVIENHFCGPRKESTPEQIAAVHEGLKMLAGRCDGARQLDGCGFSKFDSRFGKGLAYQDSLTPKQARAGRSLITKYRRQLPDSLVEAAGGELAKEK